MKKCKFKLCPNQFIGHGLRQYCSDSCNNRARYRLKKPNAKMICTKRISSNGIIYQQDNRIKIV